MLALTGDITIFRKKGETNGKEWCLYSTTIGSKNEKGEYVNYFLNVNFTKDVDVSKFGDKTSVLVQDAFLSTTPRNNGDVRLDLVIKKAKVL